MTYRLALACCYALACLAVWALVPGVDSYGATMLLYAWVPARTLYVLWQNPRAPLAWGQASLGAVFGFCAYVGYSPGAAGQIINHHAGEHMVLNLFVAAFIVYDGHTDYFARGARAEAARDAAAARASGAESRTLDVEEMWWKTGLPLVLIRLPLAEGVFRRVSDSFAEAIGTTPEAMHGRSFMDFLTPNSRSESMAAALRSDAGHTDELRGFRNEYLHQVTGETTHWEWIPVERDGSLWLGRNITADLKRASDAEAKAVTADEERRAANARALAAAGPLADRARDL